MAALNSGVGCPGHCCPLHPLADMVLLPLLAVADPASLGYLDNQGVSPWLLALLLLAVLRRLSAVSEMSAAKKQGMPEGAFPLSIRP